MKVHIVLNSHLDPVWLWNKEQGMDEVVATARTACDLLDDYPEIFITRGEAWFYEVLEFCAPDIYERVKKHVASGRWQAVGNWYIQPDCNQPSPESFAMQAEVSREIFSRLGARPSVGYNVDSFGHAATLPDFYRACGCDAYIMMRPAEHEMHLPGHVFRWQSPNGSEITVCRIEYYFTKGTLGQVDRNVNATLEAARKQGLEQCLCFVGVGDHGGGPTRREIEYLRERREWAPGVELEFSHPRKFFDDLAASGTPLPVVREELQQHAIGCYSVMHHIKQLHRRGEETLKQARYLMKRHPDAIPQGTERRLGKWMRTLMFNEFHDLMGGCSIKSAMDQTIAELGGVAAGARDLAAAIVRRVDHNTIRPNAEQRAVFHNASDRTFKGLVEFEPWLGYRKDRHPTVAILDEGGAPLPFQELIGEAGDIRINRYTLALEIPPDGRRELRIKRLPDAPVPAPESDEKYAEQFRAALDSIGMRLDVIDDDSDTWSHDMSRYKTLPRWSFTPAEHGFKVLSAGPLLVWGIQRWKCPAGEFTLETRLYRRDPAMRFRLRADWNGRHEMVKLNITPKFKVSGADFGCPGGVIERPADGRELPFYNSAVLLGTNRTLAVVSRDIYGCDLQPGGTLRLTLLRSPYYAHKTPFIMPEESIYPICDKGEHNFDFTVIPSLNFRKEIEEEQHRQSAPVYFVESTLGCGRKYLNLGDEIAID